MIKRTNAIVDPHTGKIIVQTPLPPINCLAFEGGGSRCPAYVGCYKVLYKIKIMDEVVYISGSSGGSIAALAIALGYDPGEAETALLDLDLEHFLEGSQSALNAQSLYAKGRTLLSILTNEKYSLSSGNEFLEWLQAKVEKKMGNKHATFADLAKKIKEEGEGTSKYKYLYITGTNLSLELPECKIFSHETTPDMELALAAYISSCIPGVFPLVEYDGCLWGDGGLVNNLPTKIFDDRRFLPKGFGFTSKGVNPGVLALKVDSKAEINQILYGIVRKVELNTANKVMTSLYNALSQNTDTNEIREARMTIALPDNNISSLEFNVNMHGKIGLITSAEKETQDFFENYYHSAYEIKIYDDIPAWLNSLSLTEIDDVLMAYENMENKAEVTEYINFLETYLQYRRKQKRHPELKLDLAYPKRHIDIPLQSVNHGWSKNVECEMKETLKHVKEQIISLDQKIESMGSEFTDIPDIDPLTLLHHPFHFENIRALTNYFETRKIFYEEKRDLRIKLGLFGKRETDNQNTKQYFDFIQMLNPLLNSISIPADLATVLPERLPVFNYKSYYTKNSVFSLDLRDESDRMLYIIAVLLYLDFNKSLNKDIFVKIYCKFLPEKTLFPKNIMDVSMIFKTRSVETLVIAYRIEELLHLFEKRANPKAIPILSIDTLFGVDKLQQHRWAKEIKNEKEIAMKHIIHSNSIFCYSSSDDSQSGTDKSLLNFDRSTIVTDSSDSDSESDKRPAWFMR